MAGGGFLKLGDIKGESRDSGHKDWIDLIHVGSGITRPVSASGNTAARNKGAASLGDIQLGKHCDCSTPKLNEAICDGKVFPEVQIHLVTSYGGDKRMPYYTYELKNVMITNYNFDASCQEGDIPSEHLSLNYEEIKWTYTKRDKDGAGKGDVQAAWKVEEGVKA